MDLGFGFNYFIRDNLFLTFRSGPSFLITESTEVNPDLISELPIETAELQVPLGFGLGYNWQFRENWKVWLSGLLNGFLVQFHDNIPEQNPLLFQLRIALMIS